MAIQPDKNRKVRKKLFFELFGYFHKKIQVNNNAAKAFGFLQTKKRAKRKQCKHLFGLFRFESVSTRVVDRTAERRNFENSKNRKVFPIVSDDKMSLNGNENGSLNGSEASAEYTNGHSSGQTNGHVNGHSSTANGHTPLSVRVLQPSDYVGFDSLPEQYVNRTIRDGFVFNVMVIGCTGVGKTTLIDSLFNSKFPDHSANSHDSDQVQLNIQTHELQEKHIKLKLSVIETQGFCDQIDKTDSYRPIVKHINEQFENYLQEELKMNRSTNLSLEDSRVHCCLYLLPPTGHGLRAIDLITMKQLDNKVNLIPIIAKSDMITKNELQKLKSKINSEILNNGIKIYKFPADDQEVSEINTKMNSVTPFAVIASHDFVKVGSKLVRARQYPWGTVQVENENHSDFTKLREVLLRVNMEDLRESTHLNHYELYRRSRLEEMGFGDTLDTSIACSFQVDC